MKAILIDDEALALDFLESQLNKLENLEVVGKFTFFDLEIHKVLLKTTHLVFLDIEMPEINGLELAEKIVDVNPDISIVFVTAYNEYAVKAFELNVLDYLLKPVQVDRLKNTIQRIQKNHTSKNIETNKIDHKILIYTGKELSFEINGELHVPNWRTAKTKELFLYLLQYRETTIRKDFLAEFFWEDLGIDRAYSQMYTAIYHMRKTLRPFKEHFTIKSRDEGYVMLLKNVEIDMYKWEEELKQISSLNQHTMVDFEKAMQRYTGPYLDSTDYLWAKAEQFRLEEQWFETAYRIADYYAKTENWEKAKKWYINICDKRDDEENAHFELMKIYAKQDNTIMVNLHYEKLANIYEELNLPADEEVKRWYANWMKHKAFY